VGVRESLVVRRPGVGCIAWLGRFRLIAVTSSVRYYPWKHACVSSLTSARNSSSVATIGVGL
jgi:hypothetical protein